MEQEEEEVRRRSQGAPLKGVAQGPVLFLAGDGVGRGGWGWVAGCHVTQRSQLMKSREGERSWLRLPLKQELRLQLVREDILLTLNPD